MKSVQFESISFPKISINIPLKTQIKLGQNHLQINGK
jgi:hypothetical protein